MPETNDPRTNKPVYIYVPLHSWWQSKNGERLFCITGFNETHRWVLERGKTEDLPRLLTELQQLIKDGHWVPVYS